MYFIHFLVEVSAEYILTNLVESVVVEELMMFNASSLMRNARNSLPFSNNG